MTLIDAIQNFAVDTGGYEHLLGSGWNYMATDQANYGMIAAWRYLNGMRSLYDMRPEFTEEQKEQIQSLGMEYIVLYGDELTSFLADQMEFYEKVCATIEL